MHVSTRSDFRLQVACLSFEGPVYLAFSSVSKDLGVLGLGLGAPSRCLDFFSITAYKTGI